MPPPHTDSASAGTAEASASSHSTQALSCPTTSRVKPAASSASKRAKHKRQKQQTVSLDGIGDMIEQIRQCETILAGTITQQLLSNRLQAKANRVSSLRRRGNRASDQRRHSTTTRASLDRNNNKCCSSGQVSSGNALTADAPLEAGIDTSMNSMDEGAEMVSEEHFRSPPPAGRGKNRGGDGKKNPCHGQGPYPKHQDYCLCHKRKCQRCGCLCPCSEHACPSCGFTSRVVMTMRAVDGLREIAKAQRARHRNGRMATVGKCKPRGKRFLLSEGSNECSHAVMVRVGGGFVPLVEYLKSHNKVVLSKFTRGDGSTFLSPWRPHYAGPLRKGRPRGIRYVDSVTQQLEEIIFANREAGKSNCTCP